MAAAHVAVHVVTSTNRVCGSRVRTTQIGTERLTTVEIQPEGRFRDSVKRAVDIGLGIPVTLFLVPVIGLISLLVLIGNGRPVFFRQVRVGRDGRPFTMLKFRTMVRDAEARLGELAGCNERRGPLFKLADDPRVTRLGKVLRATSLDELPQLFNVLSGDMALVGPRPALPAEVARFSEELQSRHRVRPGLTGLWQVHERDSADFGAYERLDLFYVENWTLGMDLAILARTLPAVLKRAVKRDRSVGATTPARDLHRIREVAAPALVES